MAERRIVVDPEERVALNCSAKGNPTPHMAWTRDPPDPRSAMLASGVGEVRLDIPRATVADTGRYLCQASNVVNSATPHATALVVRREYIAVT
ncbi:myoblast growth factor receptor egl-15-like [Penaeus monodon]|uniref:myoblast growth factor receptor egl-15-like n=1 Tax=Penaeus monodon TaxID=6687 RepID=UPI0018A71C77|nr:myoblast growth factor receptor egl-15-like [Penaeus monodon]